MNNEPIFSVLTGKQSCTQGSDCVYCATDFRAPIDFGQFTISNAGNLVINDGYGYDGTYNINGVYSFYTFYNGSPVYIKDSCVDSGDEVCFSISSYSGDYNVYALLGYSQGSAGHQFIIWNWGGTTSPSYPNICRPTTFTGYTASSITDWTINSPAPTVVYNDADPTNKNICINAGGVYGEGYDPDTAPATCTIYTIVPAGEDPSIYECSPVPHIGGSYYLYDDSNPNWAPYTYSQNTGYCCDGLCSKPHIYDPANCNFFSTTPC